MRSNGLVAGDESQAVHCSYEFLPGKIFPGGHQPDGKHVVDWTEAASRTANSRYTVDPAAVVWVRARDAVRIPRDICGLWIKTNTLSRQGLMLINSSLVEPGYEGYLSCNFVNFGKSPVYLSPDRPIAKLLFLKLDMAALVAFDKKFPEYDEMIAETADKGPSSFLQISDIARTLENEKAKALEEIKKQTTEQATTLLAHLKLDMEKEKDKELAALKNDFDKYFKKAFYAAFAALVVVGALSWVSDCVRGRLSKDVLGKQATEALVEKEVAKRMEAIRVFASPSQLSVSQGSQSSPAPQPTTAAPLPNPFPTSPLVTPPDSQPAFPLAPVSP